MDLSSIGSMGGLNLNQMMGSGMMKNMGGMPFGSMQAGQGMQGGNLQSMMQSMGQGMNPQTMSAAMGNDLFGGVQKNVFAGGAQPSGLPQDWKNSEDKELVNDLKHLLDDSKSSSDIFFDSDSSTPDAFCKSFSNALSNGLNSVNTAQVNAEKAVETLASGGNIDVHSVMIASEKANLSIQLAMQLRNKAMAAYQEISRMQI